MRSVLWDSLLRYNVGLMKRRDPSRSHDDFKMKQLGAYSNAADGDQMILDQLAGMGEDLTHPREIVHYLYFPTQEAARTVAGALREDGFTAEPQPAANAHEHPPNPWLVLATGRCVVNEQSLTQLRDSLEELAESMGGEYDGWETAVEAVDEPSEPS
jgi:hypothetical protein